MNTDGKSLLSTIKSVDKALEVLEAFSTTPDGINLSSLSEKLQMNKSGVYRLLQAFKQRGYVEQECKNGKYHLGLVAYMVGQNIVSKMDLLSMARPVMERLARACKETVYLVLPSGQNVLMFDSCASRNPVNVMSLKGRHYPMSGCAAGDMLLAYGAIADEGGAGSPLGNDVRLSLLNQQGYSADANQLGDGVVSLAVPLLNAEQIAVGSLCFVGPDFRLSEERIASDLLRPLIDAGQSISMKLGYSGTHREQMLSYQMSTNAKGQVSCS